MNQSEDKRHLAGTLKGLLNNCVGFQGDALETDRKQAYDYYFQRPRGDEVKGRSTIVSGDLSAMVEGNLAQMVEPLTGARIAEFSAYDQLDYEQAALESDCVNEMLFARENGFIETTAAIKDALLVRNGVIKVYVDVRKFKKRIRKSGVEAEIVPEVLDQIGETKVHSYDPITKTLSATITKEVRKFCVEAIAPENFLYSKNWHRQDLDGIPICAERHVEPRSSLIERGFSATLVESLQQYNQSNTNADDRRPRNSQGAGTGRVADKGQQLVEWYECYVQMTDSDGYSELHCISYSNANGLILEDEIADTICYATGTTIINPHSFLGISLHDKLKSSQDSSTALTRGLMDNLNATTKPRTAHLEGVVDADSLADGRVNNSIPVDGDKVTDVRAAIVALPIHDTSANILQNLQHFSRVRSEMGGASLDMATGQMQLNDRLGSQGLDRAYSVMEAMSAFMTRIIAQTMIRQMYLKAHEVLRTQWHEPICWKRGNEWVKTTPSEWPVRESVKVKLGASQGERSRMMLMFEKLMAKQEALATAGMENILVDVTSYYAAFVDWLRCGDVPVPERYILDPRTDASQKALKSKATAQAAAQQKQQQTMDNAIALEHMRIGLDRYKHDSELQYKYFDTVLDAEVAEATLATNAVVNLSTAKARGSNEQTSSDDAGTKKEGSNSTGKQSAAA